MNPAGPLLPVVVYWGLQQLAEDSVPSSVEIDRKNFWVDADLCSLKECIEIQWEDFRMSFY